MNTPDNNRHFDVIIVLGAAVWEGGRPSPALRRRLLHAVTLMKEGKADYLLVTGGLGKYPPTEAAMMKDLATDEGIPAEKIITEEKGTTTFESITECVRIMRNNDWLSSVVVSDPYHLFRATFVFRCFGISAVGSGAKGGRQANTTIKWWYYHLREIIALFWYVILVLIAKFKLYGS